jgi:myo-inositol-1(or 4)-monophosphatase
MGKVIREAGAAAISFFRGDFRVERKNVGKSVVDIVTDADRASEEVILEALRREFPGHDVMSEETPFEAAGSEYLWLIDPLDGTVNFAHGFPVFSVSMALTRRGEILAGMVFDPLRDECFSAALGGGARLNDTPMGVSAVDRMESSLVATGFPYDRGLSPDNNVKEFSAVVTRVQGMRRDGSAAVDLAYVACGRLDGFWELKLKPWDMGAGMLLVAEAGGRVSDRAGEPTDVHTPCVVATNGLIHDPLLELLESSQGAG